MLEFKIQCMVNLWSWILPEIILFLHLDVNSLQISGRGLRFLGSKVNVVGLGSGERGILIDSSLLPSKKKKRENIHAKARSTIRQGALPWEEHLSRPPIMFWTPTACGQSGNLHIFRSAVLSGTTLPFVPKMLKMTLLFSQAALGWFQTWKNESRVKNYLLFFLLLLLIFFLLFFLLLLSFFFFAFSLSFFFS